jgi:hypothetical protein
MLIKQVAELKPLKGPEPKILTGSEQPNKRMGTDTSDGSIAQKEGKFTPFFFCKGTRSRFLLCKSKGRRDPFAFRTPLPSQPMHVIPKRSEGSDRLLLLNSDPCLLTAFC